jgi:hypothetical protein
VNRNFVIGIKAKKVECLACGITDSEAFALADKECKNFDSVDIYLNATPHSSFEQKSRDLIRKMRAKDKADAAQVKKSTEKAERAADAPAKKKAAK